MINVGKLNRLIVKAEFPFGFHLSTQDDDERLITLPATRAPKGMKVGDEIEAFVATDEDRQLVAYLGKPKLEAGETAVLKATGATHFGAFFDWGLEKDLLVPVNFQEKPINPGMHYVVHAFYDEESGRVLGATRLHYFLNEAAHELNEGDDVDCLVYSRTDLGFKVVINQRYLGVIFHSDAYKSLNVGSQTAGVIKHVRDDGKIDVVLQRVDSKGRKNLEEAIIEDLKAHGGLSTLTDKSPPDEIYARFDVSKAAYKKALGALYKQKRIVIDKQAVRLVSK
ncbi:hypothetical protein CA267_000750 [Alteromonas pelagimontana]|uniref:GntR family transcriptional regulator n=1 Tax=Alteromonas pelagimontana TaxID=1858656 RepID=A0A6M4M9G7_9ALTE|nr:S1-like domain-containing RNA-binding protein [Alteromonas pelagimontana]QJR79428.1 hypothetical protein CA267_000750 [Alteromonas pelagimontana]